MSLHELKNKVVPALKQWGIAKLEAEYSGNSDDGCINDIAYFDAEGQPMDVDEAAYELGIEDILYEFLPDGFEVDLGSEGTLTVDVTAGTLTLDHGEHVTEWSTTRWEV